MSLDKYGHLIADLAGVETRSAEAPL